MSRPNYKFNYFSEAEYLEFEENSLTKHEYFEGEVFAMSGGSMNHQLLTGNVFGEIRNHLKGSPCLTFSSDMKVRADDGNKYFYPDVVVACEKENREQYFLNSPRLIVEVLSKSTRKFDQDLKRQIYQTIPTLDEYILIEQDRVEITVFRKSDEWRPTYYYIDDEITFTSIDLTLPVLELYQRVENDDMRDFLKTREENQNEL
ncbi:MAG: Uma2 family endonuclease [Methylococcales bacterium]|nr:Uma2 family endonuclease [Methylococcales bacterium]